MFKMESQRGPAVEHRKSARVPRQPGREGPPGRRTRVRMAEALHRPPERPQHGSSAVLQYKIEKSFKKERGREDRVAQRENKNQKSLEFW